MSNSVAVLIFSFILVAVIVSVFVVYLKTEKKKKVNISRQFRTFSETYEVSQKNLRTVPRVVVPEDLSVVLTLTDDEYFGLKAYAMDLSLSGCAVRPDFPLKRLPVNAIIKNVLAVTPINTFAIKEMKTIRIDHHIQKRLMAFHILHIDEDQFENLKKFMMYLDEFNKKKNRMMKIKPLNFPLKELFIDIFKENVYLVGGTIRDHLLYDSLDKRQDIDLMVTGYTYNQIQRKLQKHGKTNTVGRSFAVVKFARDGLTFDISVPRKDVKRDPNSHSHKNFIVDYGPHIPLEEDLSRRDFTCNSIAMRLIDNHVVDPFNGISAIQERRIVMTGPKTFADDPLRILRAARFASVHRFTVDEDIYMCAKDVPLNELSKERVIEEWFRLLLESPQPSIGMQEYLKLTVLEKLFPPFYPLSLTIQDSVFHPEEDEYGHHTVWYHTLMALDIAKKTSEMYRLDSQQTLALLLGILFHDVGKAVTTKWEFKRGRMTITSMFHDTKGATITDEFLTDLKIETRKGYPLKETVLNMVKGHLRIWELYRNRDEVGFKAFSRLVRDMGGQDFLLILTDFADRQSREPEPLKFDELDEVSQWYLSRKEELKIDKETIQPIVNGRDLIKLGIQPGVQMGVYLKQLYEKQLDGEFETLAGGLKAFQQSFL